MVNEKLLPVLNEEDQKRMKYIPRSTRGILMSYIKFGRGSMSDEEVEKIERVIKMLKDPEVLFIWYKDRMKNKIKQAEKDLLGDQK